MTARENLLGRLLLIALLIMAFLPLISGGNSIARGASTITGGVFYDRNCNNLQDFNEAAFSNWKIYLRGQVSGLPPILDSTTTTADGLYSFSGLNAGTYDVLPQQQAGHAQSSPSSVDRRFTLGINETLPDVKFGFKVIADCDTTLTEICAGGVDDFFSTANGPEPSFPSAGLLAEMASCGTPLSFFDSPASGACFGHTFSGCWTACALVGATVQLRLRASSSGSTDDELHFGDWPDAGSIWSISLSHLLEIKTGGADVSWDVGDTMTVSLDLSNLPANSRGITNIIAATSDGDFDILVRNDTEVDLAGGQGEDG